MDLLKEKYSSASKALGTLEEIIELEKSELVRDAAIQRFEYTVEAVWKCVQAYLREKEGIICHSPKTCLREAATVGLLVDDDTKELLVMIDDRNLTSHTYHEKIADDIFNSLPDYAQLMKKLLDAIHSGIK